MVLTYKILTDRQTDRQQDILLDADICAYCSCDGTC